LDVRFENPVLTIHGKVSPRHDDIKFLHGEYGIGDFHRTFTIGEAIDTERISAELKNGVLTVHLPKNEKVKPRRDRGQMLLMQRPLRIVSGSKSEPPAPKAKDAALSPPRVTSMKGLPVAPFWSFCCLWDARDHQRSEIVCAKEGGLVMTRFAWMTD
jgi:hypothetical protein